MLIPALINRRSCSLLADQPDTGLYCLVRKWGLEGGINWLCCRQLLDILREHCSFYFVGILLSCSFNRKNYQSVGTVWYKLDDISLTLQIAVQGKKQHAVNHLEYSLLSKKKKRKRKPSVLQIQLLLYFAFLWFQHFFPIFYGCQILFGFHFTLELFKTVF